MTAQPSKISARNLTRAHIDALAMNAAFDAAQSPAPVAAPVNDAPPASVPSVGHIATAIVSVAAASVNAEIPAAPPRAVVGVHATLDAATLHPALTFNGCPVNGAPVEKNTDPAFIGAPVSLKPTDAHALYTRAALLLASVGANFGNGFKIDPLDVIPADAFDPLAVFHLSNRPTRTRPVGYFAQNRVSDLDRLAYATRAAMRLVTAADSLATDARKIRRNSTYSGGFNSTDATRMRRDEIAASLVKTLVKS